MDPVSIELVKVFSVCCDVYACFALSESSTQRDLYMRDNSPARFTLVPVWAIDRPIGARDPEAKSYIEPKVNIIGFHT